MMLRRNVREIRAKFNGNSPRLNYSASPPIINLLISAVKECMQVACRVHIYIYIRMHDLITSKSMFAR